MLKIAVLISGGGSNLLSIIEAIKSGYLSEVEISYVISDRTEAQGAIKAKELGFNTIILDRKDYGKSLSDEILKVIDNRVDMIVLAGYLSILNGNIINKFKDRIINIHPSLIPSFSGKGMYGLKVHRAAIEKGVKYSGCTVHLVNDAVDDGRIIDQKVVEVFPEDNPESLQRRILKEEHKILPKVLKEISEGKIKL